MSGFNEEVVPSSLKIILPDGFELDEKTLEQMISFYIPNSGERRLGRFRIWTGDDGEVYSENTETKEVKKYEEVYAQPFYGSDGAGDPENPDMYPVSMMDVEGDINGIGVNVILRKGGEKGNVFFQGAGEESENGWNFYIFWMNAVPPEKGFGSVALSVVEQIMEYFGWNGRPIPVSVTSEAAGFWDKMGL